MSVTAFSVVVVVVEPKPWSPNNSVGVLVLPGGTVAGVEINVDEGTSEIFANGLVLACTGGWFPCRDIFVSPVFDSTTIVDVVFVGV